MPTIAHIPIVVTPELAERFERRVDRSGGPTACHPWTGKRHTMGYGRLDKNGRHVRASRLAWAIAHSDPGELNVLHRCDNPPCCNAQHLFLGDQADNVADAIAKGRRRSDAAYLNLKRRVDLHCAEADRFFKGAA